MTDTPLEPMRITTFDGSVTVDLSCRGEGVNLKVVKVGEYVSADLSEDSVASIARWANQWLERRRLAPVDGKRRMWVRIRETEVGFAIDVDPTQTIEHNKVVAIEGVKELVAKYDHNLKQALIFHGGFIPKGTATSCELSEAEILVGSS